MDAYYQDIATLLKGPPAIIEQVSTIDSLVYKVASQHYMEGIQSIALGKPEKAIAEFEEVIKLLPSEPFGYIPLAVTYSMLGEDKKAIEVIERYLEKEPTSHLAHCLLGLTYADLGKTTEATNEYLKGGKFGRICLAIDHLNNKEYEQGLNRLKEVYSIKDKLKEDEFVKCVVGIKGQGEMIYKIAGSAEDAAYIFGLKMQFHKGELKEEKIKDEIYHIFNIPKEKLEEAYGLFISQGGLEITFGFKVEVRPKEKEKPKSGLIEI